MKAQFYLDHNKDFGGHKNFFFRIFDINVEKVMDTYYFALDNNFMPNDESREKVISLLINYLNGLLKKVNELSVNTTVLYPIDFSDEYIGFLIIQKINQKNIKLNYGVTLEKFGWGFNPSKSVDFDQSTKIEDIECWNYIIPTSTFNDDIKLSIKQIDDVSNMLI